MGDTPGVRGLGGDSGDRRKRAPLEVSGGPSPPPGGRGGRRRWELWPEGGGRPRCIYLLSPSPGFSRTGLPGRPGSAPAAVSQVTAALRGWRSRCGPPEGESVPSALSVAPEPLAPKTELVMAGGEPPWSPKQTENQQQQSWPPRTFSELCCLARMYLPRLCVSRPIIACPDAAPRASPGGGGAGWGAGLEGASHRRFSSAQAPPSPDGAGGEHVPRGEPHRAAPGRPGEPGLGTPSPAPIPASFGPVSSRGFFVNTGLAAKVRNSARFFG